MNGKIGETEFNDKLVKLWKLFMVVLVSAVLNHSSTCTSTSTVHHTLRHFLRIA